MSNLLSGKIYIKKRSMHEWLILLIFFLPFTFGTFIDFLGVTDSVRFLSDLCILLVLFFMLANKEIFVENQKIKKLLIFIGIFLLYVSINYIFNFQSPFYFLWGLRNNFRFYFAFLIYAMLCTEYDAEKMLKSLDVIFWIHIAVTIFQFFALGYEQDYLGGIFGVQRGCNAHVNIFFCIIITKSIIYFLNKKESLFLFIFKCFWTMIISAMAELKFFYFEFVIIVLIAVLVTKFTWRKFAVIISSFLAVVIGIIAISYYFPNFANFFTFEFIIENATSVTGYTNSSDLNRLTAIPVISRSILETPMERLFGLGLGNCDVSSLDFLNTPFYETYSFLNYNWFSLAFLYLEIGIVGLLVFLSFFILCIILTYTHLKKGGSNVVYCQMAILTAILAIIFTLYNSSMRLEAAFLPYFILALPFISSKGVKNERTTI